MDAFDADVLIYAAKPRHPLGRSVRYLFGAAWAEPGGLAGLGSVLLVPEVLSKPRRDANSAELRSLEELLGRLDLRPLDLATAELAASLGAIYGLRGADAVHLATAVAAGADRFVTNNKADFAKAITEVEVTYPEDLAERS